MKNRNFLLIPLYIKTKLKKGKQSSTGIGYNGNEHLNPDLPGYQFYQVPPLPSPSRQGEKEKNIGPYKVDLQDNFCYNLMRMKSTLAYLTLNLEGLRVKMKIRYGKGVYRRLEGGKKTRYAGEVMLDDVKIYIDGRTDSFISLERIEEIRKMRRGMEIKIVPSCSFAYRVLMEGEGIERLLDDLLMLKRFRRVWINKWRAKHFWKMFR